MKVVTVTGYKPMELGIFKADDRNIQYVKQTIKRRLISLIEEGLEWILLSGQMGVEMWTGEILLELQEEYDIKFAFIPPFLHQERRWPEPQQHQYHRLFERANFAQVLHNKAYEGPHQFQRKDQWLIEKSDGCIILYDEETGGSPKYFVHKAKAYQQSHSYEIVYITPFDIQETMEEMRMENPAYWEN
ncbi:SLOG family protein [Pontibacillus litoralis]|uniref:Uncharacterized protein n=1 Tax=Pontibacillus litoralis JSM 072002 TaxID=1385512 RepID=A0A0A5G9X9_9BACI|nr:SLOG family protein [Pontibacillus litoralis]KGX87925.1 hypothetical protein N784_12535 [Pontibacillus litoralis JSM 072002]